MSFVVQCDFLQLTSYLLSLIVLFYYSALYVIGTIDQKSKAMSRVVRFSDSLALPRASGLGNLTATVFAPHSVRAATESWRDDETTNGAGGGLRCEIYLKHEKENEQ